MSTGIISFTKVKPFFKKSVILIVIALTCVLVYIVSSNTDCSEAEPANYSGKCGQDVTYEFDESTGILTLSGSGPMEFYSSGKAPWFPYKSNITSIVIGDTVTSIGDFAFEGCTSVRSILIPDSVESIGISAFECCTELSDVDLGKSVKSIEETAFEGCISLASFVVSDENGTYASNGDVLFSNDMSVLLIYPVAKTDSAYSIPDSVKTVKSSAFRGCTSLSSVTIPDSVETIGVSAFADCIGLKELSIPAVINSVVSNDKPAFSGCTGINKVTFTGAGSWYSYGSDSNKSSYYGYTPWQLSRSALTTVIISDGVTSIGNLVFKDCTSLKELTIPADINSVGFYDLPVFDGCVNINKISFTGHTWYAYRPSDYEYTPWQLSRSALTTAVVSDTVVSIGPFAFCNCTSLIDVVLGASVASIGEYAFEGCTSLESFDVSEENNAYSTEDGVLFGKGMTALIQYPLGKAGTIYEVPLSVETIDEHAFYNCTSLVSVNVPQYVSSIKVSAFESCVSLASINVSDENTDYCSVDGVVFSKDMSVLKLYPMGKTNVSFKIPETVTSIDDYAFRDSSDLVFVNFSGPITSIGDHAFCGCSSIMGMILPDTITSIGDHAFEGCTGLMGLSIPYSVVSFGDSFVDGRFYDLDGETELEPTASNLAGSIFQNFDGKWIKLPVCQDDSGTCGDDAKYEFNSTTGTLRIWGQGILIFDYDYDLGSIPWLSYKEFIRSVDIEGSITSIGFRAFRECSNLVSVTLPDSVTFIDTDAFRGCSSLVSINIPDSVTRIETSAFSGCSSLASINIPDSLTSIEASTFYECSSLTSVTIPDSVTSIGRCAFYNCSKLFYVSLPDSVRSIGSFAFTDCTAIKSLTIPDSVVSIGENAFYGCAGLKELTIPANTDSVGSNENPAFEGCVNIGKITFTGTGSWYPYGIDSSKPSYCGYTPWQLSRSALTAVIISDRVTFIGNSAFKDCTALKELTIPANTNSVGSNENPAFEGCCNIEKVRFTGSGEWFAYGEYNYLPLFCGYTPWQFSRSSLTTVIISDSVTSVGKSAFFGCAGLKELTIPANIDCVGSNEYPAFVGCFNIQKITFTGTGDWYTYGSSGSQPSYYGYTPWQFSRSALTTVIISDSVTSIGNSAFSCCIRLKELSVPANIDCVGSNENPAFFDCFNIQKITFTGSGSWYHYGIDGSQPSYYGYTPWQFSRFALTSVIISDGITSVGGSAFKGCADLKDLSLPADMDSVVSNENPVFEGCANIDRITFTGSGSWYPYSLDSSQPSYYGYAPWQLSRSALTSVVISDSVTSIGNWAFKGCTGLKDLSLPTNIDAVGTHMNPAFSGCVNIEKVTFTGSGPWYNYGALYKLTPWQISSSALTTVIISEGVSTIEGYAFNGCSSLASVTIPDSVVSIGYFAFYNCISLASVTLPDSELTVGNYAFSGCTSLTYLYISDSVSNIGPYAFSGCTGLKELSVPVSLCYVGYLKDTMFEGCVNINKIVFTAGTGTWSSDDLSDYEHSPWQISRSALTSIAVSEGVSSVADHMFQGFASLRSVNISGSVCFIGESAFDGCTSLQSIDVKENNMNYSSIDGVLFSKDKHTLILYPAGKAEFIYEIPNTVLSIRDYAFRDCVGLDSVVIPESFATIGTSAFRGCTSLRYVSIPNSVRFIENYAFFGCTSLESVKIPDSVTRVGTSAFEGCTSLRSAIIPNSVKTIAIAVFRGCTSLASINIPDSVVSIEKFAFSGCSSLASVFLSNSVRSLGSSAFSGCTSLTSVTLPDSVKLLGYSIFGGCTSLSSAVLPNSLKSIENNMFRDCTSLKSVTIPNSVTFIGEGAFSGCDSLASITIPRSVISVGTNAFGGNFYDADDTELEQTAAILAGSIFRNVDGKWVRQGVLPEEDTSKNLVSCGKDVTCEFDVATGKLLISGSGPMSNYPLGKTPWYPYKDSIVSVIISGSVTHIGDGAFYNCSELVSVSIPGSVKTIGASAFKDCISLDAIKIPDSVTSLGNYAFYNCTSIMSVTGFGSVTTLGTSAFENCVSLSRITIPASLPTIGNSVFRGCTSLSSIDIPDSVTTIGLYTFSGCTSLTSVTIPPSVTTIGAHAFEGNPSLASVTIPYSVTTLGTLAFDGTFYDSDGETVLVPTVSDLAGYAFKRIGDKWIKQVSPIYEGHFTNSGECGENIAFEFDVAMGTLTISGTGPMYDCSVNATPWYSFKSVSKLSTSWVRSHRSATMRSITAGHLHPSSFPIPLRNSETTHSGDASV